jgi:hypothetical protein
LQQAACPLRRNRLCVLRKDALESNAGSTARLLSYPSFWISQGNVEDMLTLTDSLQKNRYKRRVWGHWFRFAIDWSGPPRFVPTHPHVGAAWVSIIKQQKQRNDINIHAQHYNHFYEQVSTTIQFLNRRVPISNMMLKPRLSSFCVVWYHSLKHLTAAKWL